MALSRFRRFSIFVLATLPFYPAASAQPAPAPSSTAASLVAGQKAHLFGGQFDPDNPTAVPEEVKPEWAGLIGEYGPDLAKFYVLEDSGELCILAGWFDLETLRPISADVFELPANGPHGAQYVTFLRDVAHAVTGVRVGNLVYDRWPFDGPGQVFQITPLKPVAKLRAEALATRPPDEKGTFRESDLVQLNHLDTAIKLDIRYATSRNFLGAPLYFEARAYMQRPAAEAVVRASQRLQALGYGLLIHDSYRPWYVTKMFWEGTPPEKRIFVANPEQGSRHNRGCAVDLTLYDLKTGEPIRMTGGYDEMSERSYPFYPGGTARERWHRDLLRRAMEAEGFTVYEEEWWHFDYKDWKQYPILNLTFEQLENSRPQD
jgi:D-alanyl-D-alanine dipeptidase